MKLRWWKAKRQKGTDRGDSEARGLPTDHPEIVQRVFSGHSDADTAGVSVSEYTALNLGAVYSCVRVVSEDMGSLPRNVFKRDGNRVVPAPEHPVQEIIANSPTPFNNDFDFFETAQAYVELWGNFYAVIHRDERMRPVWLEVLHPNGVTPYLDVATNRVLYMVSGRREPVSYYDMIHVRSLGLTGLKGLSPVSQMRYLVGEGLGQQRFNNDILKNRGAMEGVFTSAGKLTDAQREAIKDYYRDNIQSYGQKGGVGVFSGGIEYKSIGMSAHDVQFLEGRKLNRSEIAGWFRVPGPFIGDTENISYKSLEQQTLQYLRDGIRPRVNRLEAELNKKLFPQHEASVYFIRHDMNDLMRADMRTRMSYYQGMHRMGAYTVNDILEAEGRNPVDDGDKRFVNASYMPQDMLGDFWKAKIQGGNNGQGD